MNRRAWLRCGIGVLALAAIPRVRGAGFSPVVPGRILRFPEDEGSHPDFRTEWWYVTGWLDAGATPLGFQVTFFGIRPQPDSGNPSRFNPREVIIAHAAVSERAHGRLRHAQRLARAGFGLAGASAGATGVHVDDWRLQAQEKGYLAHVEANDFAFDLRFDPAQAPLLQGDNGYSRKGPQPAAASYYYSLPHLQVNGRVRLDQAVHQVRGSAWLDHEWSSEYMAADAVGWDWAGINLDDGAALMAFRMRARNGGQLWAAATLRSSKQGVVTYQPHQVSWSPRRMWRSPRTGATYPVAMRVHIDQASIDLIPMMDDQENDTRLTTGAVYWEGAVEALREGARIGRGYLELTGYVDTLQW